jgi:nicotinamide-nucleotide amidase
MSFSDESKAQPTDPAIAVAVTIGQLLRERGETLSTAESCTGGLLSGVITAVPGSSDYFLGGVVSYANEVKQRLLGVSEDTLKKSGAVSQACVSEMARGARRLLGTTYGVAISGVAGPGGGSKEKPVGTVHFAVDAPAGCITSQILRPGDRDEVRRAAVQEALRLLQVAIAQGVSGDSGQAPA